jgi:serine O-acetyltransferase
MTRHARVIAVAPRFHAPCANGGTGPARPVTPKSSCAREPSSLATLRGCNPTPCLRTRRSDLIFERMHDNDRIDLPRMTAAAEEIRRLRSDVGVLMNWRAWRWLTCWLRSQFWAVASYRLERALFLAAGPAWRIVHPPLRPLVGLVRPGTVDIHCEASIGHGMLIAHPALGLVISAHAVIGERAVLTGGNCIGVRRELAAGDQLRIGNDVTLGANAVVLGPIRVGDSVVIGAGAVATHDVPDGAVLRSPPALLHRPQDS